MVKNEEYIKKWKIFFNLLKKKGFTINSFSKKYNHFEDEWLLYDYNEKKFLDKLKKMKSKYNKMKEKKDLKGTDDKSLRHLNDMIKFLEDDFIIQEMHDDESYENWFD